MKFDRSNYFFLFMLLWTSKFATVKVECSFEIGKWTSLGERGVSFILLAIVQKIHFNFTKKIYWNYWHPVEFKSTEASLPAHICGLTATFWCIF